MLAVIGTVPVEDFPLVSGQVTLEDNRIFIQGRPVSIKRGTPALLAAAIKTCQTLGHPLPFGYLVGDTGLGYGSRLLYEHLSKTLVQTSVNTIAFHYLQPDVDWHNRVIFAVEEMKDRPILIADAGFMYGAKMSGEASKYDLFTPDVGELAFLADEQAPHPFYTRGFILHEKTRVPELISRAYRHNNAPQYLLVKGEQDYLADSQGIRATIDSPMEEVLEAIGGTGDTLTGIAAALIEGGIGIQEAAVIAARANRLSGFYAGPTPATHVSEIIRYIPEALEECLDNQETRSYLHYAG
jgi:hypothetical protein